MTSAAGSFTGGAAFLAGPGAATACGGAGCCTHAAPVVAAPAPAAARSFKVSRRFTPSG
jgi:hypothetical protein